MVLARGGVERPRRFFLGFERVAEVVVRAAVVDPGAELRVPHELPDLLRTSKMSCQEALSVRHPPLEGRETCGEWQPRRIARDGNPMYPFASIPALEMLVQILRLTPHETKTKSCKCLIRGGYQNGIDLQIVDQNQYGSGRSYDEVSRD